MSFQRISPDWVDKPVTTLYPHSDRGRQVKHAGRIIARALEFSCTAAESNCLFDMSGRFKCERHQAFAIHRQVAFIKKLL